MSDTKYTEQGDEVEVIAEFHGGFLIRYHFDDDDQFGNNIPRLSEPTIVKHIFNAPPSTRRAAEIEGLESQIKNKREELRALTAGIKQAEAANKELFHVLSQNEALENLKDFIDGKITHYVLLNIYTGVRIAEAAEFHNKQGNRLLSLFGGSNGLLTWGINKYSDGSGSWTECWPCMSSDQANHIAKREINLLCDNVKLNTDRIARSLEATGIKPSKRVAIECAQQEVNLAENSYQAMMSETNKHLARLVASKLRLEEAKLSDEQQETANLTQA